MSSSDRRPRHRGQVRPRGPRRIVQCLAATTLVCLGGASTAVAYGSIGALPVLTIRHLADGDTLIGLSAAHDNPDGCDADDQLLVTFDDANRRHMLAAAIMAKAAKGKLTAWVSECVVIAGVTYPRARTLQWRD